MRPPAHLALLCAACSGASGAPVQPHNEAEPRALVLTSSEAVDVGDVVAHDGGIVLIGSARRTLALPGERERAFTGGFVLAFDLDGRPGFLAEFAGDGVYVDGLVRTAAGELAVAGFFAGEMHIADRVVVAEGESDGFVALLDPAGGLRWLAIVGGPGKQMLRRTATIGDRVYAIGSFDTGLAGGGGTVASRGSTDVCIVELGAADGNVHAVRTFGSAGEDIGRDLVVSADRIVAVGHYGGAFGPDGPLAIADADRGIALAERVELPPPRDFGGFVVAMNRAGAATWAVALDDPGLDVVKRIAPHQGGWVVTRISQPDPPPPGVDGFSSSNPTIGHVVAIDRDGAVKWSWTDVHVVSVHGVASDGDQIVVVGHHRSGFAPDGRVRSVRGDTGFFTLSLSGTGRPGAALTCDGPGADHGYAAALAGDGSAWVGGLTAAPSDCAPGVDAIAIGFVQRWPRCLRSTSSSTRSSCTSSR